jgi:head-tail adaptor
MNQFIDIVSPVSQKDAEGFTTQTDSILASVRAYVEQRHGSENWANRAAFTTATALFRFRRIPDVEVNTTHSIIWNGIKYRIHSVEDVRNRGMYTEALAEKMEGSMR